MSNPYGVDEKRYMKYTHLRNGVFFKVGWEDCTDEIIALKEEVALWKERAGNASKEVERLKNVDHTYCGYIMVNEDEYHALHNERERWRDSSDKKALELQSLTEDLRYCIRARDKFERELDEANRAYKAAVADLEAARGALKAEHKVACQERDAHVRMIAERDTAKADIADMSLELSKVKNELDASKDRELKLQGRLKEERELCVKNAHEKERLKSKLSNILVELL